MTEASPPDSDALPPTAFDRLLDSIRARDICRLPQYEWHIDEPGSFSVEVALKRYFLKPTSGNDITRPVLLRTDTAAIHGIDQMDSSLPYGAWFPDRACRSVITLSAGGETYLDYAVLDDGWTASEAEISFADFSHYRLVDGDASLRELVGLHDLNEYDAMLVILGNNKFGVLTLEDLFHSLHAKACWLTLVLELERAALELLKRYASNAYAALPELRREAAIKLARQREEVVPKERREGFRLQRLLRPLSAEFANPKAELSWFFAVIFEHTLLSDKKVMISSLGNLGVSKTRIKAVFEKAERLRNWCAHTTADLDFQLSSLEEFRKLIADIRSLTQVVKSKT